MAHIWVKDAATAWQAVALVADECTLTPAGPTASAPKAGPHVVMRRSADRDNRDIWALLASPDARPVVNGHAVALGLAVLADRDEIRWRHAPAAGQPLYFSTEQLAAVEPYPDTGRAGSCPRCKQQMTPGEAAVRCPACGLWHHASETLPCWTYEPHCAACDHTTAIDAGFQWTPEDL